jgi:hypothetical protein
MTFFGETCVRCGEKRTHSQFEGFPTCTKCELKIQAGREQERRCPVDGDELYKSVVHNMILDRCPTCAGVWLDGDELGLLKKTLSEANMVDDSKDKEMVNVIFFAM